jgi:hypothetical protein
MEQDIAIMEIADPRLRELLRVVTSRARRTCGHDDRSRGGDRQQIV